MFKGIVSGIILMLSANFAFAQTSDIICSNDLAEIEKTLKENFKENFIFSGVNSVNIYFRFYAGPKSWTIVFKRPDSSYCTGPAFSGITTDPPKIQNKAGINV